MSNNAHSVTPIKTEATAKEAFMAKSRRKLHKLKRDPKLFLVDSKGYLSARKTAYLAKAKLGSFILVIIASLLMVTYFTFVASPRYVSQLQFVVKQASGNEMQLGGLMALGGSSPSTRDALILKEYITSQAMALALDEAIGLKAHYQQAQWDAISRLSSSSSQEDYVAYYQAHIEVRYDELSEILLVEAQGFDAAYSLQIADTILSISKGLINSLGDDMAQQHMNYAKQEVQRAYAELKQEQAALTRFQDANALFNPELQSSALFAAISNIEASLIEKKTELKSLQAYLRNDAAEIKAIGYQISALEAQLKEEKSRLTNQDATALNKVNVAFKELEQNTLFAADMYRSAMASLEMTRAEAFKNIKYLLVVVAPMLAEDQRYPQRLYSIFTWFVVISLFYLIGRLVVSVIKEHQA